MTTRNKIILTTASFMCAVTLAVVGCDNEDTFEARISPKLPKGFIKLRTTVVGGSVEGNFTQNCPAPGGQATLECVITVVGTVNGQQVTKAIAIKLKATGPKGARFELECDDPIAVQFPADATNFVGTFDGGGGNSGSLTIQSGLSSISIAPGQSMDAEPGQQLVIVGLPAGLPAATYDLTLEFDLAASRAIDIKPLVLGKVVCDNETFFPPIVPCGLIDLSSLPAVTIPVSADFVPILPPLDGVDDCEFGIGCSGTCPLGCCSVEEGMCDPAIDSEEACEAVGGIWFPLAFCGDTECLFLCQDDAECDEGQVCVDGQCVTLGSVPTVTEWGLIVMTLLLLTAGTIVFGRRRRPAVA